MPTIRNAPERSAIIARLRRLTPESAALWGTFSAPRMICHLADSLRVPLGDIPSRPRGSFLARTLGKWIVVHTPLQAPRARVKTMPEMLTTTPSGWETDLKSCEQLLDRVAAMTADVVHPKFGRLSPAEWGRLAWKHHDHHLRQFGV